MNDEREEKIKKLEAELSYLVNASMDIDLKIKRLSDARFQAWNSGYCEAMAGRLMGGFEDEQTRLWEKNCENKYKIDKLYDLLTEEKENSDIK